MLPSELLCRLCMQCHLEIYYCFADGRESGPVQTFVADAGKTAAMLAYDRPSPKLKAFLAKHYGERTPLPALLVAV